MTMQYFPYPHRKDEIIRHVKRHHDTRRCSGVWSHSYIVTNHRNKIQAARLVDPAPYPTVVRAFCRREEDYTRHAWVARMSSAGITSQQIDDLIQYAHKHLQSLGKYWVHTLSDYHAYSIASHLRLRSKGYTGEVYYRNQYHYLGTAGRRCTIGFTVDGIPHHIRQGKVTLSDKNVHAYFPDAREIRAIKGHPKRRWVAILADTPEQYQQRLLLMKYRPQPYTPSRQPLLLIESLYHDIILSWLMAYST